LTVISLATALHHSFNESPLNIYSWRQHTKPKVLGTATQRHSQPCINQGMMSKCPIVIPDNTTILT
jgi:hypothetical protein